MEYKETINKNEKTKNNIKKHQFTDSRPEAKWMRNFLKRNRLRLKKAEMNSTCPYANTSIPSIIYDFYDSLEKVHFIICELIP